MKMNKEYLEALKIGIPKLKEFFKKNAHKMSFNDNLGFDLVFVYLDKALQRLESIDNANPSEALEKLDKVNNYLNDVYDYKEIKEEVRNDVETIKQALQRLEAIDNANPSEALFYLIDYIKFDTCYDKDFLIKKVDTIKQYILKAQDNEKVLEIIKEKRVDLCILTDCDNVNEYNKSLGNLRPVEDRLTYEEFELLKRYFK